MDAHEKLWQGRGAFGIPESDYTFYSEPVDWVPPFVALMWLTGARVTEMLAIRGRDFKFIEKDGHEVVVVSLMNLKQRTPGKGEKETYIVPAQYPEAWACIDRYQTFIRNPLGIWFPRKRIAVWYACKKLFDVGPHKVGRHSWTMEQARTGAQLLDIRQEGGWSSLDSMDKYISKFGRDELIGRKLRRKVGSV